MKPNELNRISDSIEALARHTETSVDDIIDALIGVCWDEEDAAELKFYETGLD